MKAIRQAIASPEDWVLQIDYRDKKGVTTRRVVSPIKVVGNRILALCLCREENRQFDLGQCSNITLKPAGDYLMPVPMQVVPEADETKNGGSNTTTPVSPNTNPASPSK